MAKKDWLGAVTLRKIMLHLDTDISIEGLIAESSLDGVLLKTSILHAPDGKTTEMGGDTWVPRERIVFAQGL